MMGNNTYSTTRTNIDDGMMRKLRKMTTLRKPLWFLKEAHFTSRGQQKKKEKKNKTRGTTRTRRRE
jgi:hypothetical protein